MATRCNFVLNNVYYAFGSSLEIKQGDVYVMSDGTVSLQKPKETPLNKLNGDQDHSYLALPTFYNSCIDFTTENNPEYFSEEEVKNGIIKDVSKIARETFTECLSLGITRVNVFANEESKLTLEQLLSESQMQGSVHISKRNEGVSTLRSDRVLSINRQMEDYLSSTTLGTGKVKYVDHNLWSEIQHLCLSSKNGYKENALIFFKKACFCSDFDNIIEEGKKCDIVLLKVPSSLLPFDSLYKILSKFKNELIQGTFCNGKLVYSKSELTGYISPFENQKMTGSGCEFDSVESAIADFVQGKFVVIVDNEDRENEGDLIIAGEFLTEEKMAFMIRHTSGLICIALTKERLEQLELPLMVIANNESFKTAFTISVDYIHGTTTGISAYDRALTCRSLANPNTKPQDFARPGHMFPLRYTEGGVLKRLGHTEASIDMCKMAGVFPAGVLCEIALDNGKMARRDYLRKFSKDHGLKMITISDMIKYRKSKGLIDNF